MTPGFSQKYYPFLQNDKINNEFYFFAEIILRKSSKRRGERVGKYSMSPNKTERGKETNLLVERKTGDFA